MIRNSALRTLINLSLIKTIRFNFHYFKFKDAIRLPVFVYRRTLFKALKGCVVIDTPFSKLKTGMIRIGIPQIGLQDSHYSRTIWQNLGGAVFNGKAFIGRGTKICIEKGGSLQIGSNFSCTGDSTIICSKSIILSDDSLLSWDILIMDTDFHRIFDENNQHINKEKPIFIGKHVWIGCRTTILKGSTINDEVIVAAGSIISGNLNQSHSVYGGLGKDVSMLRSNVSWYQ